MFFSWHLWIITMLWYFSVIYFLFYFLIFIFNWHKNCVYLLGTLWCFDTSMYCLMLKSLSKNVYPQKCIIIVCWKQSRQFLLTFLGNTECNCYLQSTYDVLKHKNSFLLSNYNLIPIDQPVSLALPPFHSPQPLVISILH